MDELRETEAVTRRFLQTRRRALFTREELLRLLTDDAEYVEVMDGQRLTISGAEGIVDALETYWSEHLGSMAIIRHATTGPDSAVGHWRRTEGDSEGSRVVYGRDTYQTRGGLICSIEVEEFEEARVPKPVATRAS